jgi:hypothetical protein
MGLFAFLGTDISSRQAFGVARTVSAKALTEQHPLPFS